MPPKKVDPSDPEVVALVSLLESSLSFTKSKALETAKSPAATTSIVGVVKSHGLEGKKLDAKLGTLVATAATATVDLDEPKRDLIVRMTLDGKLNSADRINTAAKFAAKEAQVDEATLGKECGVGVVITSQQIQASLAKLSSDLPPAEDPVAGWAAMTGVLAKLRADPDMRWAAPLDLKNETEATIEKRYGPRANAKAAQAKQKADEKAAAAKKPAAAKPADAPGEADPDYMFKVGFLSSFHKPGGNPQIKPELRDQHLKATGGKVFTRFPPEPNGFLHIGHAKAIAIDFGYARMHGGHCYLRYDDTNPAAEEQQYFEAILEMVRWLGFEPWKITYSSDYFQRLYDLAVELIKRGKAYVDHSTPEDIKAERGGEERGERKESKWRNRPVEESLAEFEKMKNGEYPPGKVTLRMKQDILGNGNPQMWDLIAYRVLDAEHHRTGDKWRIYPTYDFTHCLVDSFENISHSLCTTEFVLSRESYEWLCDALEVYKPRQYEFGRLNLEGTITSKRKILALVNGGHVNGWDDPRLFTLLAQRRRGVPPGAILSFINSLGVSTAISSIQISRYEQSIRQYLESSTPRLMMVLKPVKIVLDNVPDDFFVEVEKPLHPKVAELGKNKIPFSKVVYIDASDFRTQDSADYFRLAPGKTVGLLNAPFPVTCLEWKDAEGGQKGEAVELRCRYEDPAFGGEAGRKPKAYIQWVAEHKASASPVVIDEVRVFHPLFQCENPAAEKNFLDLVQKDSLEVIKGAMVEVGFWSTAEHLLAKARKEAKERTEEAEKMAAAAEKEVKEAEAKAGAEGKTELVHSGEGAPKRSEEQLVGTEVVRFQGMRLAYFCLDRDSVVPGLIENKEGGKKGGDVRLVLNQIVTLKQEKGKN